MAATISQWLNDAGLTFSRNYTIADVEHFGFGEAGYYAKMHHGQTHFDNDLDRLLDVVLTEAETRGWGISMTYGEAQAPVSVTKIAKRNKLDLIVHINQGMDGRGGYNNGQIDIIRQMVTLFNLTGSWDSYSKANL